MDEKFDFRTEVDQAIKYCLDRIRQGYDAKDTVVYSETVLNLLHATNLYHANGDAPPAVFDDSTMRDAARYRWLRSQHWDKSDLAVVVRPKQSIVLGSDCPSHGRLDEMIDDRLGGT